MTNEMSQDSCARKVLGKGVFAVIGAGTPMDKSEPETLLIYCLAYNI